jgi:hypothetical protein
MDETVYVLIPFTNNRELEINTSRIHRLLLRTLNSCQSYFIIKGVVWYNNYQLQMSNGTFRGKYFKSIHHLISSKFGMRRTMCQKQRYNTFNVFYIVYRTEEFLSFKT